MGNNKESNQKKKNKKNILFTIFGVIFILSGIMLIVYPFLDIFLDKRDISKNIDEWDKKKVQLQVDESKDKNKKDNKHKYPTVNIDGKEIIGKIIVKTGEQIPIIFGATEENLRGGATLYDNGVFIGDDNTAIILGHRETTFGFLEKIEKSDIVEVETLKGKFKYKVKKIYVTNPEDESILAKENKGSLTLVTCYPFRYVGPAPERFIVKFDLIK